MILVACISCGPITINFRDGCYDLLLIYYNTITGRDQFGTKTSKITNHQYQSGPRLQKSQITSTNSGPTPTFIAKMTYFRFGTGNFGTGTAMSVITFQHSHISPYCLQLFVSVLKSSSDVFLRVLGDHLISYCHQKN